MADHDDGGNDGNDDKMMIVMVNYDHDAGDEYKGDSGDDGHGKL